MSNTVIENVDATVNDERPRSPERTPPRPNQPAEYDLAAQRRLRAELSHLERRRTRLRAT